MSPRQQDISVLIKSLQQASVGDLLKGKFETLLDSYLSALATISGKPELDAVFTNARKAIAEIDYAFFGPQ